MKILAYVVRVECKSCKGKKVKVQWPFHKGKLAECCYTCKGLGHTEAVVPLDDVVKLIRGLAKVEVEEVLARERMR